MADLNVGCLAGSPIPDDEEKATKRPRTASVQLTEDAEKHLAARGPVGATSVMGPVVGKNCMYTTRYRDGEKEETMALGGACSECFSGPRLAKVLEPALKFQMESIQKFAKGEAGTPLSIHTSVGLPLPLGGFVDSLEKHLPWPKEACQDWWVNFQLEGATAVWAAIESLMHLKLVRMPDGLDRGYVGVATRSYHGPKTTALGMPALPRWPGAPRTEGQVAYPVPLDDESTDAYLRRFDAFMATAEAKTIGVMVFEPQWGSSYAAKTWPPETLRQVIRRCKTAGILVLCDEIMCGLGRHGRGTLFLSEAWDLDPDAVTFGKAISAGAYQMSGVIVKSGAKSLKCQGTKVAQSHTYAGSSAMALLTAKEVVDELPKWFDHAKKMGEVIKEVLTPLQDAGFLKIHGQGLMWGGVFTCEKRQLALELMRKTCLEEKVWPYLVPVGGFMMSPPMDVKEDDLREGLRRLERSLLKVKTALTTLEDFEEVV